MHGFFQFYFSLSQQRLVHSTSQYKILFPPQCRVYLFLLTSLRVYFFQTYLVGMIPCQSLPSLMFETLCQNDPGKSLLPSCIPIPTISERELCISFSAPQGRGTHFGQLCSASISYGQWPWEISLILAGNSHILIMAQYYRCLLILLKMRLHFYLSSLIFLHYFYQ